MDAAAMLVGTVLTPLALGRDARGTAAWRVRGGIDMARRRRAAAMALELAAMLRAIEAEPLAPDAVLSIGAALARRKHVAARVPTALRCMRPAESLERIANAPALASQKPLWRGYFREVVSALAALGLVVREADAVRLRGVDIFDPTTEEVRSSARAEEHVACWFVDTDYDGDSVFVRHAYFLRDKDPFEKLKIVLKAELDEAAWFTLYATGSPLPAAEIGADRGEGDQPLGSGLNHAQ